MVESTPTALDLYVGRMIRAQRKLKAVSQQALADAIGTSFQQIQKYERATNRVSASRLARIARALEAPIATFFPEALGEGLVPTFSIAGQLTATAGGLEMARCYLEMDGHQQSAVLNVARAIANYTAQAQTREAA